jgi:heat-inducible transcriptional repressor
LSDVRTQVLDHIEAAEQEQMEAFTLMKELAREAFDLRKLEQELYVDGKEHIVNFPDFDNYQQLSSLLKVVEEKNLLAGILEKEMKKGGLTVKIGSENRRPELHGVSLVSSIYKMGENPVGVLGILGPRRMEYARMMSLVEGVARIVNQMLSQFETDLE